MLGKTKAFITVLIVIVVVAIVLTVEWIFKIDLDAM